MLYVFLCYDRWCLGGGRLFLLVMPSCVLPFAGLGLGCYFFVSYLRF